MYISTNSTGSQLSKLNVKKRETKEKLFRHNEPFQQANSEQAALEKTTDF